MAKRRLSKQQHTRIARQHTENAARVGSSAQHQPEDDLGPEQEGLVVAQYGTQVEVESAATPDLSKRCFLRANLGSIVTGDRVVWRDSEPKGIVVSVLPRRSQLARPDSFGNMKIVAANIDRMLITVAPEPEPHANLIDRYLVVAETLGLNAILLINKIDLFTGGQRQRLQDLLLGYRELGYPVMEISAHTGTGLSELVRVLSDGTSVFVGQSGAGKSSIIQTLLPDETIKIGELSEQVNKGRHTTTNSRLYHFPNGGHCIDSPGIREFGLWHMEAGEIAAGFREFQPFLGACRFRDCRHKADPGCALKEAVAEGRISAARFDSYIRIVDSLDAVDVRTT
jgi:ribosome biogenesis GTPase